MKTSYVNLHVLFSSIDSDHESALASIWIRIQETSHTDPSRTIQTR